MPIYVLASQSEALWQRARRETAVPRANDATDTRGEHWILSVRDANARQLAAERGWLTADALLGDAFPSMDGIHCVQGTLDARRITCYWVQGLKLGERELVSGAADVIWTDQRESLDAVRHLINAKTLVRGLEALPECDVPRFLSRDVDGALRLRMAAGTHARIEPPQRVVVIGAGIAGALVAAQLQERGVKTQVIDAAPVAGAGASALAAGLVHPHWQLHDNPLFRLTRLGFRRLLPLLAEAAELFSPCGVLDVAQNAEEWAKWQDATDRALPMRLPVEFASLLSAEEFAQQMGWSVPAGGWWYPCAGLLNAGAFARHLLARSGALLRTNCRVTKLEQTPQGWCVRGRYGEVLADADAVVLCTAMGTPALLGLSEQRLGISALAGRISLLSRAPAELSRVAAENVALTGRGYFAKVGDALSLVGATYERAEGALTAREAEAHNMALLEELLPGSAAEQLATGAFYQGVRAVAQDRLPFVGAAPTAASIAGTTFKGLPESDRVPTPEGLWLCTAMGSRGLTWGVAAAEALVGLMMGTPLLMERSLLRLLHPARFLRKSLVRS